MVFSKFEDIKFLEFVNQEVYSNFDKVLKLYNDYGYFKETTVLKYFFEFLKFTYTSVDYNGKDGALRLDVRQDLTIELKDKYDIITNIGFSEHVGEDVTENEMLYSQYNFFKNLHNLGHNNTLYYHCVPLTHNWYKHGVCDYSLDFFKGLCEKNNYRIIEGPFNEDYHKELQASVFYIKSLNNAFMTFEEFNNLKGLRSTNYD